MLPKPHKYTIIPVPSDSAARAPIQALMSNPTLQRSRFFSHAIRGYLRRPHMIAASIFIFLLSGLFTYKGEVKKPCFDTNLASNNLSSSLRNLVSLRCLFTVFEFFLWVLLFTVLYLVFRAFRWYYSAYKIWAGNQFDKYPDIKKDSAYQDPKLLDFIWSDQSSCEVAKRYKSTGGLCYQPKEGWCGYATVNSVISSVVDHDHDHRDVFLQYEQVGRHISMYQMVELLTEAMRSVPAWNQDPNPLFLGFQAFSAQVMTVNDWKIHMRHVNDPNFRYILIFHRAPLFFNSVDEPQKRRGFTQLFAEHWSPLIASIKNEQGSTYVAVGDVNQKYDTWLVDFLQLYESMKNRNCKDGDWKGLIRFNVNPHYGFLAATNTLSSDPASSSSIVQNAYSELGSHLPPVPKDLLIQDDLLGSELNHAMRLNKLHYYCHVQKAKDSRIVKAESKGLVTFSQDSSLLFFNFMFTTENVKEDTYFTRDIVRNALRPLKEKKKVVIFALTDIIPYPARDSLRSSLYKESVIPASVNRFCHGNNYSYDLKDFTSAYEEILAKGLPQSYEVRDLIRDDNLQINQLDLEGWAHCVTHSYTFLPQLGDINEMKDFLIVSHKNVDIGPQKLLSTVVVEDLDLKKIVATGSCFVGGGVGAIYNVCVLKEARGKHLGFFLMLLMLDRLRKKGARHCVLESTPEGTVLYKKMGFRNLNYGELFVKFAYKVPILQVRDYYFMIVGERTWWPLLYVVSLLALFLVATVI